jgi:hypothetical protein
VRPKMRSILFGAVSLCALFPAIAWSTESKDEDSVSMNDGASGRGGGPSSCIKQGPVREFPSAKSSESGFLSSRRRSLWAREKHNAAGRFNF